MRNIKKPPMPLFHGSQGGPMNSRKYIVVFTLSFLLMLGTTIWASLQQNIFTEFDWSNSPMWFQATLVDFYINQLILWLWVFKLETNNYVRFFWLIIFIGLGSMGTTLYIIIRLWNKKSLMIGDRS